MWLKGTDQFLPSSPVDYQEFLPLTDSLLDDLEMFKNFGGMEVDPTDKGIGEADEFYVDLMGCTIMKHHDDLHIDVANLSTAVQGAEKDDKEMLLEENLDKNSVCLSESPQNVDTRDQLNDLDNSLSLSSVSKVFTWDNSKNDMFCDLKMFLEKKYTAFPSVATSALTPSSKEGSIFDDSSSKMSGDSEMCSAFCHSEAVVPGLQESSVESDECSEPKKKIRRLSKSFNSKSRDQKYAEMRQKNNVASRRSRQTKKQKEKEMEEKAVALEKENESLRKKEEKLQELVNKLKEMLFSSVNRSK